MWTGKEKLEVDPNRETVSGILLEMGICTTRETEKAATSSRN